MLPFEEELPFEALPFESEEGSSFMDTLKGLGEETLALGTGFAATPLAGLAGLSSTIMGGVDRGVATQEAVQGALTYQPRTAAGQRLTEAAGQILNLPGEYGEKAGGAIGRTIGGELGERTGEFLGRVGGEFATDLIPVGGAVAAFKARKGAPKEAPRPRVEEATKAIEARGDPLGLFEQAELFPRGEEGLATPYEAGQMGVTEPVAPKLQRRQMELPFGDEVGPLTADIQGQIFRGDVTTPEARLALEGQAKAFATELEKGTLPDQLKKGEPLPALQDPAFVEALKKAYFDEPQKLTEQAFETLQKQQQALKQKQMDMMFEERPQTLQESIAKQEQVRKMEDQADQLSLLEEELRAQRRGTPVPFNYKRQGGAINLDIFKPDFWKEKKLEGSLKGLELTMENLNRDTAMVVAWKGGKQIGKLRIEADDFIAPTKESNATAGWVEVDPEYRKTGLVDEMYKFITQQGSDVVASKTQLPPGKRMWERFEKAGLAQQGRIRKQGGGILFDWKDSDKVDKLKKMSGLKQGIKAVMPTEMSAAEVIDVARTSPDVEQNMLQKAINAFTKGGLYQSVKTNHPFVQYTTEKVLEADRLARADIRDYIHDSLAPAMRDMSMKEQTEIAAVLNAADLKQVPITDALLDNYGFNAKQKQFVQLHRQTMDFAFEQINKARAAVGKDPIDKRVAYASMQATGDYRKLVYKTDADGNKEVVGILGASTRPGLARLEKKMQGKGYEFGEERYYGNISKDKGGSAQAAVLQALEHLAENNPATKDFLDIINDMTSKEAYQFLNAKKHTLGKKGVFGMEGRKPWESAEQNAKDFMDSQLRYAETAIKWGHLSDAASQVKEVLSSDVNAPNAKKWSESYLQSALGMNPSKAGRALEDSISHAMGATGIGKSIPAKTQMYAKKLVNTMLLGLNPAFLAANVVQPIIATPGMNAWLKQQGLSENSLLTMGFDSMFLGGLTSMKELTGGKMSKLEQGALDYAKKYHVYGSDLVDTSILSRKNAEFYLDKMGNFLASNVESSTRRMMFHGFVHMLDKQKRFTPSQIYSTAHNLTDMAMNNYSTVERPTVFNALGPIGDLAANLSSFKHNELSRMAMFAREIGNDKSVSPLLVQLAASVAAAGLTGTLAFQEADWLYKQITKAAGKPDSLTQRAIELSEKVSPKGTPEALSHGLFSFLGLDMSKRLGMSDVLPNDLLSAVFPGGSKLVDVAKAGAEFVTSPGEMSVKQLAREVAPGVLTGPMDLAWFSKQTPQGELALNRRTLEGQVVRSEADRRAKLLGFTGIKESVAKQKLYEVENINKAYADLRAGVLKKARNEMFTNGKLSPTTISKFIDYEGDPATLETDLIKMVESQSMSAIDAAKLRAAMGNSITQQRQAQRLMRTFK